MAAPAVFPAVQTLVKMLPVIVRLFPELMPLMNTARVFSPAFALGMLQIKPLDEEAVQRELSRALKAKRDPRWKNRYDETHVIKVVDAIHCLENRFQDTTLIVEFLSAACRDLWAGKAEVVPAQKLLDKMAECIRSHALGQSGARTHTRTSGHGRPARGHGHGRILS